MRTTYGNDLPPLPGAQARPFDPTRDYGPVAALISRSSTLDGEEWAPSEELLRHDWQHQAGFDPARDVLLAEVSGEVVGCVSVFWRERDGVIVHPLRITVRREDRRRGLGSALLGWGEGHAREMVSTGLGGPRDRTHELTGWATVSEQTLGFTRRHGYEPLRYFNLMLRDLHTPIPTLPLPEGLEVRPVVEADHRRIWDADEEAFLDHFGVGPRTEEEFVGFFTGPDVDTSLWQVAWDGPEVAGSVATTIYRDENERLGVDRGWLDHVSVRRPWRRRGLASALIVRSMAILRERGVGEAALGVDSENPTGALGVYERLGFARAKTSAVFVKPF